MQLENLTFFVFKQFLCCFNVCFLFVEAKVGIAVLVYLSYTNTFRIITFCIRVFFCIRLCKFVLKFSPIFSTWIIKCAQVFYFTPKHFYQLSTVKFPTEWHKKRFLFRHKFSVQSQERFVIILYNILTFLLYDPQHKTSCRY